VRVYTSYKVRNIAHGGGRIVNIVGVTGRVVRQQVRGLILKNAVIVAGLGRCGTTLLYQALRNYGFKTPAGFVDDLEGNVKLEPGCVYKTHALPPSNLPEHVKLVFMFGNPMDIVISTHKMINRWGREHHRHMGSDRFVCNDCVLEADTLQLHKHFDSWYCSHSWPFISLRYEALYKRETLKALRCFLGINFKLPPFHRRSTDWTQHPEKKKLWQIYGDLNEKIARAEDVRIWSPKPP
jgi:hypothetical protein